MEMNQKINEAYDKCLGYLTFKSRTEKEMTDYLEKKGYDERVTAAVMAKLCSYNFINDTQYVKDYCYGNVHYRFFGRVKMAYDLRRRGIAPELIAKIADWFTLEEEMACCAFQFDKAERKYEKEPYMKRKGKIYALLQRKGFPGDIIRETIEARMHEASEAALSEDEQERAWEDQMDEIRRYYDKYYRMQSQKGYEGWERTQRIKRNLMGRGYSREGIEQVVREREEGE